MVDGNDAGEVKSWQKYKDEREKPPWAYLKEHVEKKWATKIWQTLPPDADKLAGPRWEFYIIYVY
jgi:hypothetical protein